MKLKRNPDPNQMKKKCITETIQMKENGVETKVEI